MREIVTRDIVQNVKLQNAWWNTERWRIWNILEEVIKETPSGEPRTDPSPFGNQAFEPVLIDGKKLCVCISSL